MRCSFFRFAFLLSAAFPVVAVCSCSGGSPNDVGAGAADSGTSGATRSGDGGSSRSSSSGTGGGGGSSGSTSSGGSTGGGGSSGSSRSGGDAGSGGSSSSGGGGNDAGHDSSSGDGSTDSGADAEDAPATSPDASDAGRDAIADGGGAAPDAQADSGLGFACSGANPSLKSTIYPVLNAHCSGELCHGSTLAGAYGGAANVHAALVNVPMTRDTCNDAGVLVSPGSLPKSYLMNKLTGVGVCPGTDSMPRLGGLLPAANIQAIADWICKGAPND